jgi:hypothetical protein
MILPLRQRVSEMMVRVHLIPPDLAEYHVRQMPPSEIRERFKMYVKFGLARRRWEKNEVAKGVTKVKLQIESTSKVVEFNGVPARIWEGHTESGIPVHCFITRIAVEKTLDTRQFDAELQEQRAPSPAVEEYPLRMVI